MSPLFGPDPTKIREHGAVAPGVIVGIEVKLTHDDAPSEFQEYAVESNGVTYGIRQTLTPLTNVRLGTPVQLRVDGKHAVIDWGDGIELYGWKSLGTPPSRGITDRRDGERRDGLLSARKKGTAATVEFLEFTERTVALGLGAVKDARSRVSPAGGTAFEAIIPKVNSPFYASHLMSVGAVLPAWHVSGMMGERLVIDWPAAAEKTPGVGVAATAESAPPTGGLLGGLTAGSTASDVGASGGTGAEEATPDEATPEIPAFAASLMSKLGVSVPSGTGSTDYEDVVPWDLFLQVNHDIEWKGFKRGAVEEYAVSQGVPPGEWSAAHRRWLERMGSDMALMTAFGQAMSKP